MSLSADVVVVGAGAAGAVAGTVLGRRGLRVILVDPRLDFPPAFKGEKIEVDHVRLLRKLDLLETLLPYAGRADEILSVYDGRVFDRSSTEQYGFPYADMVNAFRARLPATVSFKQDTVRRIESGAGAQRVQLAGGEELTSRLVVLACGPGRALQASLGLGRRVVQKERCFVLGFAVSARDGKPFGFDSVTCFPVSTADRISYLTLFNFRRSMRANLFVFRPADDPWVRRFLHEPDAMLAKSFPKLTRVTGGYDVSGKIDCGCVDLHAMEGVPPPGVAVIGDAFQTACPTTGLGLLKVLTDVDALAECLPSWLSTPGMGPDKLSRFYGHPRKLAMDRQAIQAADYLWRAACDRSLRWRAHRLRTHLQWRLKSFSLKRAPAV